MSGFNEYDQWKTASPYDDYDDEHCVYCGADLPDDVTDYSDADENAISEGFCNVTCESTFMDNGGNPSPNWGKPHLTKEQEIRLFGLRAKIYSFRKLHKPQYAKLTEVLEYLPDGDFHWDDSDPGDANVYCCGEKDCPTQWHEAYYNVEFERKDGKLEILVHSGDCDGNWDYDDGWTEGENFQNSGVAYHLGPDTMNDHFMGWAEYYLDSAITGDDPCNQLMMRQHLKKIPNWIDICLDAAENNIKYLRVSK